MLQTSVLWLVQKHWWNYRIETDLKKLDVK